jgi:carbonic anhydrase/acetyltransferase-like protein (isoleucine patch superfamily)
VLHADPGAPCLVGTDCTIGHAAVVHGCVVGDSCLVGMGTVLMNGADVGSESLVAAGSVVPEGARFPPRSLIVGVPARRVRQLDDREVEALIRSNVRGYVERAASYREGAIEPVG